MFTQKLCKFSTRTDSYTKGKDNAGKLHFYFFHQHFFLILLFQIFAYLNILWQKAPFSYRRILFAIKFRERKK
jgi:hypothetical protein